MKTKELIAQLQKEDPEGETEVVVGGTPIHFVAGYEGYYDGHYEILLKDPSKDPYYSIIGGKATSQGRKVKIHLLSIEDALYNCGTEEELDDFVLQWDFGNSYQRRTDKEKVYQDMVHGARLFVRMFKALKEYGADSEEYREATRVWDEFENGPEGMNQRDPWESSRVLRRKLRDAVGMLRKLIKEEGPAHASDVSEVREPVWWEAYQLLEMLEDVK